MPKKTYLFLATTWTVFITVLSLVNVGSLGNSVKIPYKDKMVHFVFYFFFYILWYGFFRLENNSSSQKLRILFFAIGYGIVMELLQGLMSNQRSSDVVDVFANSSGAIFGLVTVTFFLSNKKDI